MNDISLDKWDYRWLEEAKLRATYSKDPSTKVGAVIANGKRHISFGYNGFPSTCPDHEHLYLDRPTKYKLVTHAEVNAIFNSGLSVRGCRLYTYPLPPCSTCASLLAAAGIGSVVSIVDRTVSSSPTYLDFKDTEYILGMNSIPWKWVYENNRHTS